MPSTRRFYLLGVPAHAVQRGNNRQAVFFDEQDYIAYLRWFKDGADKHGGVVHAFVPMTNHVHLLMTSDTSDGISKTIQSVGRHYVTYINYTNGKSGTLWEGRYTGCIISSKEYLLGCMRYIELTPVRAGMVDSQTSIPGRVFG